MNIKILILAIVGLIIIGCAGEKKITNEERNSEKIVSRKIISETNKTFFENYFKPLRNRYFTETGGNNHIFFEEKIPILEYCDTLEFIVNNGKIVNLSQIKGIPDCFSDEKFCVFQINKDDLLRILNEKKLLESENEFLIKAVWQDKPKRFLWKVTITKEKFSAGNSIRGNGIYVFVNPENGEIIKIDKWQIN